MTNKRTRTCRDDIGSDINNLELCSNYTLKRIRSELTKINREIADIVDDRRDCDKYVYIESGSKTCCFMKRQRNEIWHKFRLLSDDKNNVRNKDLCLYFYKDNTDADDEEFDPVLGDIYRLDIVDDDYIVDAELLEFESEEESEESEEDSEEDSEEETDGDGDACGSYSEADNEPEEEPEEGMVWAYNNTNSVWIQIPVPETEPEPRPKTVKVNDCLYIIKNGIWVRVPIVEDKAELEEKEGKTWIYSYNTKKTEYDTVSDTETVDLFNGEDFTEADEIGDEISDEIGDEIGDETVKLC